MLHCTMGVVTLVICEWNQSRKLLQMIDFLIDSMVIILYVVMAISGVEAASHAGHCLINVQ